jgi:putative transposase
MPVPQTNPKRKPTRLKDFDYSTPGAYFVTIVAHDRKDPFGTIENGQMVLSAEGKLVRQAWFDLPRHYANVRLDEEDFVIMPNHAHGIVVLLDPAISAGHLSGCGLTEIIRAFKSFSAQRINQHRGISGVPVWQRSFYERILRDEGEWDRARKYILQNPQNWQDDQENAGHS